VTCQVLCGNLLPLQSARPSPPQSGRLSALLILRLCSSFQKPEGTQLPASLLISEYDLVFAYEVDSRGDYVSHDIVHHQRRRRALAQPGGDSLHLRLKGSRHDFQVDLKASSNLVAPGFVVQTLGKRGTKAVQMFPPEDFCFYQGSLRSHRNSSVALSTCQGLVSAMVLAARTEMGAALAEMGAHHQRCPQNSLACGTDKWMQQKPGVTVPDLKSSEMEQGHGWWKERDLPLWPNYTETPPTEDLFVLPDEYESVPRCRRSLLKSHRNKELNVETLVVVDRKMMQNHGQENITTYVLTILNMVSALFKDGTIGGNINIAVVGLILLEDEQPGLVISHHADHTLSSFCQWQSGLMGKDGTRHDHAILLTGLDICSWKNEPCDTLGFAPISGMCSKYRSCTINEDTGLGLAFTIAHESGHNFGMVHDGEGNMCKKSEGNIMSPTLAGRNGVFSWSPCSRQYLHKFLSTTQAVCLADQPKPGKEYKYPEKLPGELYDANTQCKWQFGEKAKLCMLDFKKDICKALWCHRIGRKCETKFMPAAEGTLCGQDMWCRGGQCVKYGDQGPKPTHGHWSDWSPWSPCSRTCGGGVSHRDRLCTNPRPSHGGKFCEGPTRTLKLCHSQPCPQDSMDFRAAQCAAYNSQRFRGWHYKWKPYTQVADQDLCKLYCIAEGFDFFFSLSNKVKDGTPCSEDSRNVCVDGICEVMMIAYSFNTCLQTVRFEAGMLGAREYYHVATLPPGARSIRISEMNTSTSYISVRNALKRYYLNGHWTVDWPGRYEFAGTTFRYRRSYKEPESLTAAGPTNETLMVELLFQGRNPGISWEYSVPRLGAEKKPNAQPSYTWAIVRSECSVSCGGGRFPLVAPGGGDIGAPCIRPWGILTGSSSGPSKTHLCPHCGSLCQPPSWSVGNWSICSRTCGRGTQSRPVRCTQRANYKTETVSASLCPQPVPTSQQACNSQSCPPAWSAGPWAEVTGWGSQGPCHKHKKLQWLVSAWSKCSATCERGTQKRFLKCAEKYVSGKYRELASRKCLHVPKPDLELARPCALFPCPAYPLQTAAGPPRGSWVASPWSQCSASCGGGVQRRSVQCMAGGLPASDCSPHQKPESSLACNTHFCTIPEKKDTFCKDYFHWCHLVPQHGMCSHKFYGKQCCKTCSKSNL
uniref:ADAM metallopeptidase with thrombospondin type 1 motif 16 n=1 Tax=Spermophilus dauricus TaxID=99837 RepID=A0A8C9P777_SPEDA